MGRIVDGWGDLPEARGVGDIAKGQGPKGHLAMVSVHGLDLRCYFDTRCAVDVCIEWLLLVNVSTCIEGNVTAAKAFLGLQRVECVLIVVQNISIMNDKLMPMPDQVTA
eukprot:766885-Hanusia_phi.AAC.3